MPDRGQPNGVASNQQQHVPAPAGRAALLKQQPAQLRVPQQRPGERIGPEQTAPLDEMAKLSLDPSFKKGASGTRYAHVDIMATVCVCLQNLILMSCSVPLSANYLMLKADGEGIFQYHVYFE